MMQTHGQHERPLSHTLLTRQELELIEAFRTGVETMAGARLGLTRFERHDREDHWIITSRWPIGNRWWLELVVRPSMPQIGVIVVTDDPERSRDAERMIAESSLTMGEYVGAALKESGLSWPEPPVEHYREGVDRFCFATPLDIESLTELAGEAIQDKVLRMLDGYCRCFSGRMGCNRDGSTA
jgi:hypothetical protein